MWCLTCNLTVSLVYQVLQFYITLYVCFCLFVKWSHNLHQIILTSLFACHWNYTYYWYPFFVSLYFHLLPFCFFGFSWCFAMARFFQFVEEIEAQFWTLWMCIILFILFFCTCMIILYTDQFLCDSCHKFASSLHYFVTLPISVVEF